MPFNSNAELPARIKKKFPSQRLQTIWRKTWNSAFIQTKDEGRAFAIATTAANKAARKQKLSSVLCDLQLVKLNTINGEIKKAVELKFDTKVRYVEELSIGGDITIGGIALQEGTFKGIHYSAEFLKKIAHTFVGKALKVDHGKGVRDIVGKITSMLFDPIRKALKFTATVFDAQAKRILIDKLVNSVSVGMDVDAVRGKKGIEARDGEGKELSLTEEPACKTCKIQEVED